ncbi:MAG: late competence development ComFB family protein [Spirochaetales bacterium]|nr:late competence development ComFB family protein [Spirochaetales bacterium]
MSLRDQYNFENLENETERLVVEYLEKELADKKGICTCEDCVLDMAAYALNKSRPCYRVSLLGKLYAQAKEEDSSFAKEIQKAVKEAVKKITQNPSHD